MLLTEHEFEISASRGSRKLLNYFAESVLRQFSSDFWPVRFVLSESRQEEYRCEVAGLSGIDSKRKPEPDSIFRFVRRGVENRNEFNAALLVPTGIGAEIGGHAGDAAPVAQLLSQICDRVILHPNVVNASDINEMRENALYVEGSVLTRLLMGTIGLQPVRANRVLVVIDSHKETAFINAAVNSVSAARATYGLNCPAVVRLDPPVKLRARFACSGRAAGRIEQMDRLCSVLTERRSEYDAVAISSVIDVPREFHMGYFEAEGNMVNPWGGVEAMLTHALSGLYNVPTAHCPMFESQEIACMDPGIVDPRMAAEAVSMTFLQCLLKGLHRSPKIVTDQEAMRQPGALSASDVSCLVIPDGCLGLPTLAALEQGIAVIAVRENRNIMKNDLSELPWSTGQLHIVENYWEAIGVMAALKGGIVPGSVRRPLPRTNVETVCESNSSVREAERDDHDRTGARATAEDDR